MASDRLFVATRKGLFRVQRGAAEVWSVTGASFVGDNLSLAVVDSRDGAVYAALDHGHFGCKLHRSSDGGESFEEVECPAYPPRPEGVVETDGAGQTIPWSLGRIWAFAPGNADQPGVLWLGTIPGGLFRSRDGGASWAFVESLWGAPGREKWFGGGADWPGLHSICVDPRDGNHVSIGVSCGGVWHTDDLGESWEVRTSGMWANYMPPERREDPYIQDPHCVAQCAAAPDTLWAQHHNGVFRTNDRGRSWTEVTDVPPSSFGFAVAAHPTDPRTAWLVPALDDEKRVPVDGRVVVARTRDAGESFEVLNEGLPREHAYDLVFRHALDVDASGERVAFGSTTGGLWLSENQGDHWQCVTAHLPPIYSVRFG